jgi:hypothetical protein
MCYQCGFMKLFKFGSCIKKKSRKYNSLKDQFGQNNIFKDWQKHRKYEPLYEIIKEKFSVNIMVYLNQTKN